MHRRAGTSQSPEAQRQLPGLGPTPPALQGLMKGRDYFIEVCFPISETEVAFYRESVISEEEDSGVGWGREVQLKVHTHCSVPG